MRYSGYVTQHNWLTGYGHGTRFHSAECLANGWLANVLASGYCWWICLQSRRENLCDPHVPHFLESNPLIVGVGLAAFWLDPFISATSRAMPESVFEGTSLCKFFVARSDFDAELVVGFGVEVYCTPALWGSRSLEFGKIIAASTGRSKGGTFFCWFPRHAEIAIRVQLASLHMASQLCAPSRTGMGWEALWKMNGVPLTFVNTLDYH